MEKNEVGGVVVCVQDNYIRICKVLTLKKVSPSKIFFEFRNLFGIGVSAEFACPIRIQKGRKRT